MPNAVIFDCDGVLVDSELLSCTASMVTLKEFGIETELAEVQTQIGKSYQEMLKFYEKRKGLKIDLEAFHVAVEENYFKLAADLQPAPGIIELLERLTENQVLLAVASSGGYRKIEFSLEKTGIKHFFKTICSAVDVAKGKPEPDLFLYAARKLGKEPGQCIVVEDSLYGVTAGKWAGMMTVGYTSSFSGEELLQAGADLVISDFRDFLSNVKVY